MERKILVAGSSGLIGSEAVSYFDHQGRSVVGIDNNMRKVFFGESGDTTWNLTRLLETTDNFFHHDIDIRDRRAIFNLFKKHSFDLILHCAAQPSHEKAQEIPLTDFDVNATGTLNLLEATRRYCPKAVFVFLSTIKVYGDFPNRFPLVELDTRYDYASSEHHDGIDESCRIDQSLHSLFGASKTCADIMAQEYARYFGMNVGVFRGSCLTGPYHSGVELHGFLSYLVKVAFTQQPYTIFGYKGKQVRDNIHALDVITAVEAFAENPRSSEVYNIGGGRDNSTSILEAISMIEEISGKKINHTYREQPRKSDHIVCIADMHKFRSHYPNWSTSYGLRDILEEMIDAFHLRFSQE